MLVAAHTAELSARDAREAELQEAIRLNEQELDEAETAYDKLRDERDEARKIALKEQDKAREHRKKLLEEQEANRLLKLVAKARASDADEALQAQIEALRDQLRVKETEAEAMQQRLEGELEQLRSSVEEEKAARAQAEREVDEAGKVQQRLQAELDAANATAAELKSKAAPANENDDDDVNAEFQDLVRGKQATQPDETAALLQQHQAALSDKQAQLDQLQAELDRTRRELATATTTAATATDSTRELATLRDELSQSEEERQTLQVELAKVRAAAAGREVDSQKIASLDAALARANAKIVELEKEILAERAKTAEALATVARPLPVPSAQDAAATTTAGSAYRLGAGSVPSSPVKLAAGGSKLRPSGTAVSQLGKDGLQRAGSVKEYRRYQPADPASPSPLTPAGSRSVLLGHSPTFSSADGAASRAEKEEIARLNAVISSQRAIMADLEKSVASWKTRMKAQAELIHQLVVQNGGASGAGGVSPPSSDGEHDDPFSSSSPRSRKPNPVPAHTHTLPRTTHLSLPRTPGAEPYYGAHTFNRPPPSIGAAPGSPHKGYAANTWSSSSPSPLPLPQGQGYAGADGSSSKRRPRKTIEMDLKLLNSSPRVENSRSRFTADHANPTGSLDSPTKRRANNTSASAYYI